MIYLIQLLNFVRKPQIELKAIHSGVQPKLSAAISIVDQEFKIVDQFGTYIIKPQNDLFPQLPENEDVTMRMAKVFGLEVPFHGMLYAKDGSLSYFIKRFDRYGKGSKFATEDFAQLTGNTRDKISFYDGKVDSCT
jgi:serine/threonine-protein kinase HipA